MAQTLAGPITVKMCKLIQKIESLGASEELTNTVILASDILEKISNLEEIIRIHLNAPYQPNEISKKDFSEPSKLES